MHPSFLAELLILLAVATVGVALFERLRLPAIAGLIVLATSTAAFADEDELPDADFLEYLGSWEESDEEWVYFDDQQIASLDGEWIEPESKGKDSTESDDEG